MSGKPDPRRSRREEAQTSPRPGKSQKLVTSSPTLHEEATPYRVGAPSIARQDATKAEQCSALRFIDLFCGIGGFRLAFERAGARCVFSSDWDKFSRQTYALRKILMRCSERNASSGKAASLGKFSGSPA